MKTSFALTFPVIILLILHLVGVFGFLFIPSIFVLLVPIHLTTIAYLLFREILSDQKTFFTLLTIAFLAWFVEFIGVNTGIVFGNYVYGDVLGWKFKGTPILIGLNWVSLVYSAYIISRALKTNCFIQDVLAAGMVLMLDIVMEPIAVKYGFWGWENNIIPLKNYITWYILALVLLQLFRFFPPKKTSLSLALSFLVIQTLFFLTLLIFN